MKKPNLRNLSRDEKLQLLAELEEKEKRLKQKQTLYVPNDLQAKVHKSLKRIRLVTAANGVGKTCLGVWESYWAATGTNPHRSLQGIPIPNTGIVVLDSPDKVDRWMDEYRRWFDTTEWQLIKNGKPYINEINLPNGSVIKFMFHLQEQMAFESFEAEWAIFDEPSPRHCFVGVQRALRRSPNPFTLIVGTPIAQPWLKTDLYDPAMKGERDDIEVFKAGIMVNASNLGKDYIANFSRDLTEAEKKVRLHGEFAHLEGLALADLWKRDIHIIPRFEWPRAHPVTIAIDFHPSKPCTAIMLGVNKLDLFYVIKTFKSKAPPRLFAEEIMKWYSGYRIQDIVCDNIGSTPKTGGIDNLSFIQVLQKEGVPVRPTSFKEKSEDAWVQNIRDLLMIRATKLGDMPGLFVFEDLLEIINEFESVMWARNRSSGETLGYLDIGNKDLLSCLKYALAAPPNLARISKVYTRPKPSYASRK